MRQAALRQNLTTGTRQAAAHQLYSTLFYCTVYHLRETMQRVTALWSLLRCRA